MTPENGFSLLQSPMAASFTPLQLTLGIAHGDLRLVCGCALLPETVWNLVVSVATEERQFLCATHFSPRQSYSVSFCGLLLRG